MARYLRPTGITYPPMGGDKVRVRVKVFQTDTHTLMETEVNDFIHTLELSDAIAGFAIEHIDFHEVKNKHIAALRYLVLD